MSKNQALAWMYQQMREVISSFPTSIVDFIQDIPDGYEEEDESGESGLWAIIAQADTAADSALEGCESFVDVPWDDIDCSGDDNCAGCPDVKLCFPEDFDEDD